MKKFKYVAVNMQKQKFTGTFLADNERDLSRKLAEQNLYLVSARIDKRDTPNAFFSLTGKVKISELANFSRQFAIMINTGTSIVETLFLLKQQSYSSLFRKVIEIMHEDVKGGMALSEAMMKHKRVFPDFFRSMVYVGEVSGRLEQVLTSVADYFETDNRIKKRAKGALIYPAILILMAIAVVVLMMLFIIPTFRESLSSLDVEMPALTMAIYNMSDFFLENWKTILLIAVCVILLFWLAVHTKKGKYYWDKFKVYCPIIKNIQINLITARFSRGFGLLIDSGMDIVDAMEIIKVVLGNKYVEHRFTQATDDVRQGMSLTMALESYKLFPQILVQMISVGEKTGNIAEVLLNSCSFYDSEVEASLSAITTIIQPVILAFIGVAVGTLFLAIYSPLMGVMNTLG